MGGTHHSEGDSAERTSCQFGFLSGWCASFYLLDYLVTRINLVNNCKKCFKFRQVARHRLQLSYEVVSKLRRQHCQLINLITVARLREFLKTVVNKEITYSGVLLKIERSQEFVNW